MGRGGGGGRLVVHLRSTAPALLGSRSPSMMSERARKGAERGGKAAAAGRAHRAPMFCGVADAGSAEKSARKSAPETCSTSGRGAAQGESASVSACNACMLASERESTTTARSCGGKSEGGEGGEGGKGEGEREQRQ